MAYTKADKRVSVLFYLLTAYIIFQFSWSAYLLVRLNGELYGDSGSSLAQKKMLMIIGEGTVFFLILLVGVFIMQRTIKREIRLVRQQRNFLLSITHELKTPLAAIKLCLETLEKRDRLDAGQRSQLQGNALENTGRLHSLIDNVLLATRIESQKETAENSQNNLSEITEKAVARIISSQHLQPIIDLDIAENVYGHIDDQNFDSIVANLLENALKYGAGTKVSVQLLEEDGVVRLKVSDCGPGITPEAKALIFDKFYRAGSEDTRSKKGTGLGLFIVKELVGLYHGKISVRDNSPSGAVFLVELGI